MLNLKSSVLLLVLLVSGLFNTSINPALALSPLNGNQIEGIEKLKPLNLTNPKEKQAINLINSDYHNLKIALYTAVAKHGSVSIDKMRIAYKQKTNGEITPEQLDQTIGEIVKEYEANYLADMSPQIEIFETNLNKHMILVQKPSKAFKTMLSKIEADFSTSVELRMSKYVSESTNYVTGS